MLCRFLHGDQSNQIQFGQFLNGLDCRLQRLSDLSTISIQHFLPVNPHLLSTLLIFYTFLSMANPRIQPSKSRAGKEKGYFQTAVEEVTRPENRGVLIAVGMFTVSLRHRKPIRYLYHLLMKSLIGWSCLLPQQFERNLSTCISTIGVLIVTSFCLASLPSQPTIASFYLHICPWNG
jgi:hypothetical protein